MKAQRKASGIQIQAFVSEQYSNLNHLKVGQAAAK